MAITAIALLRIHGLQSVPDRSVRVQPLEDAVLLFTGESFADDPDALSVRVQALIGREFAGAHTDPRGIFLIPDVAAPKARTYQGVIEEIGEGGVWGGRSQAAASLEVGALGALLEHIPSTIWAAAGDAAQGDEGALRDAAAQLQSLLGESSEFRALAGQLAGALGPLAPAAAAPGQAPNLQQLVASLREELETDPARLTQLAEQLLGKGARQTPDKDEEES